MNLSQLYYFRKLAEVKHYTHAAEELFISQPTLSNSISQLERELGIPLFEREGRKSSSRNMEKSSTNTPPKR